MASSPANREIGVPRIARATQPPPQAEEATEKGLKVVILSEAKNLSGLQS